MNDLANENVLDVNPEEVKLTPEQAEELLDAELVRTFQSETEDEEVF